MAHTAASATDTTMASRRGTGVGHQGRSLGAARPSGASRNRVMLLDQRLRDGVLEIVGVQLLLLRGIGDEAHLDEHRRHVRADEHAERRLLDRARAHRHAFAQRRFDSLRQRRGFAGCSAPAPSPRG